MRNRLLVTALLASTLAACGSGSKPSTSTATASPQSTTTATNVSSSTTTAAATTATPAKAKPAAPLKLHASYVPPQKKLKTPTGKEPAVVLLPDTGNSGGANAEAAKLAKLGVGSLVVAGFPTEPTQASAFESAVAEALAAIKKLRTQAGVDPSRIGLVGEGVGAHVGAVVLGRDPTQIAAAVLADIGGVVVPSPKYAPERWLGRATGVQLLFQRDEAKRAMTPAEIKRLMLAAPPGTLMEQYKTLGVAAQASRDSWIKQQLLAG